jgi:hypothetical protein
MSTVAVEYIEPFGRAWKRMKELLFRPFDLGRWLAIGFTAWLATLLEGGGGGNFNLPVDDKRSLEEAGRFIQQHLALIITIAVSVLFILFIISFILAWISARGKFMFLDNALTNRAEIAAPWRQWRRQGNSLFWWQLACGFILLAVFLVCIGLCLGLAWPDIRGKQFGGYAVSAIMLGFLLLLAFCLVAGYLAVFLHDFIVPLMRKHDLKTNAAWRRFLALLRARPGPFLLYGLLRFAVSMIVGVAFVCLACVACLFTCGCAGCLLAIPFIGTVILLPIYAWERYWGPEFLRQFGPDFDCWAEQPPIVPAEQALVTAPY